MKYSDRRIYKFHGKPLNEEDARNIFMIALGTFPWHNIALGSTGRKNCNENSKVGVMAQSVSRWTLTAKVPVKF
jgi:hypothetical protein